MFLDAFDVFCQFQHVDWIRELSTEVHMTLMRGIDFLKPED